MPPIDPPVDVVVSLQVRGAEDRPWDGHLAAGLLTDTDLVVVPGPPSSVLNESVELEVLIIPARWGEQGGLQVREDRPVERIRPARIDVLQLGRGAPDRTIAAGIKLAYPSNYAYLPGAPLDGCELRRALHRFDGDLWAALEDLGHVRRGLRDGLPEAELRRLPPIEREHRQPLRRSLVFHSLDPMTGVFCPWWIPWCEPCDP
jgi:hypothetical protein